MNLTSHALQTLIAQPELHAASFKGTLQSDGLLTFVTGKVTEVGATSGMYENELKYKLFVFVLIWEKLSVFVVVVFELNSILNCWATKGNVKAKLKTDTATG